MRHVSCDFCTKDLSPGTDARYSVTISGHLVRDAGSADTDGELETDTDHIDVMDEILTDLSDAETVDDSAELAVPVPPICRTFDLCGRCFRRFAGDPLGRSVHRVLSFSAN